MEAPIPGSSGKAGAINGKANIANTTRPISGMRLDGAESSASIEAEMRARWVEMLAAQADTFSGPIASSISTHASDSLPAMNLVREAKMSGLAGEGSGRSIPAEIANPVRGASRISVEGEAGLGLVPADHQAKDEAVERSHVRSSKSGSLPPHTHSGVRNSSGVGSSSTSVAEAAIAASHIHLPVQDEAKAGPVSFGSVGSSSFVVGQNVLATAESEWSSRGDAGAIVTGAIGESGGSRPQAGALSGTRQALSTTVLRGSVQGRSQIEQEMGFSFISQHGATPVALVDPGEPAVVDRLPMTLSLSENPQIGHDGTSSDGHAPLADLGSTNALNPGGAFRLAESESSGYETVERSESRFRIARASSIGEQNLNGVEITRKNTSFSTTVSDERASATNLYDIDPQPLRDAQSGNRMASLVSRFGAVSAGDDASVVLPQRADGGNSSEEAAAQRQLQGNDSSVPSPISKSKDVVPVKSRNAVPSVEIATSSKTLDRGVMGFGVHGLGIRDAASVGVIANSNAASVTMEMFGSDRLIASGSSGAIGATGKMDRGADGNPFQAMDSAGSTVSGDSLSAPSGGFRGAGHWSTNGTGFEPGINARSLEVGYQDPALGYVELHAHMAEGGIHASLAAQSAASGATLEGHLSSLAGWMTERHTPVESLSVLAFDSHKGAQGGSGGQHQATSSGSGSNRNDDQYGTADQVSAQFGSSLAVSSDRATTSGMTAGVARGSSIVPPGSSISVLA